MKTDTGLASSLSRALPNIAQEIARWQTVKVADLGKLCKSAGLELRHSISEPRPQFVYFTVPNDPAWRLILSAEHIEHGVLADSGHITLVLNTLERWNLLTPEEVRDRLRPSPWTGDLVRFGGPDLDMEEREVAARQIGHSAQALIAAIRSEVPAQVADECVQQVVLAVGWATRAVRVRASN